MKSHRSSLKPLEGANRSLRRRLNWKGELALATAPTAVILGVLALVEVLSRQRLLFASLAQARLAMVSSAFILGTFYLFVERLRRIFRCCNHTTFDSSRCLYRNLAVQPKSSQTD
ncbi:hypothetical protein NIES22_57460 [Calothrix brevissima NIES-22]|nr:hypothetical protein NIES22_57460 [Calothrix brevissima NIES-22]